MVDVYFRPAFVERGAGGEGGGEEGEEEAAAEGRGNKCGIPPPWKTMEGRGGGGGWSGNFEGVSVSVSRSR